MLKEIKYFISFLQEDGSYDDGTEVSKEAYTAYTGMYAVVRTYEIRIDRIIHKHALLGKRIWKISD